MWLSILLPLHLHYLQLLQPSQVDIQKILRHLSYTQVVIQGGHVICILSAQWYLFICVGASLAGHVLARPLFWRFNEIHYRHIKKWCMHLLQLDHFPMPLLLQQQAHQFP